MARAKLGESQTITIKVKMPENQAAEFEARCKELGDTRSEVIRRLIERWMRQTAEIARLKQRGFESGKK